MDSSLAEAPVVPAVPAAAGQRTHWSSLSEAWVWPDDAFSVMKTTAVAKRTGAPLVSKKLDDDRLARLHAVAGRKGLDLRPPANELAEWSALFARSLLDTDVAPRTWSRFYDDLKRLFEGSGGLGALSGKKVFLDQSKRLRASGGGEVTAGPEVFVRSDESRRGRTTNRLLPPSTLRRRYRFLYSKIRLQPDTTTAFREVGLLRQYDPAEALAGLGDALGDRPSEDRAREALIWAFNVWSASGVNLTEKVLRSARLRVPTASGWRPATEAAFSSSWTALGATLQNYLVEASEVSLDCKKAQGALLVSLADWPASDGTKRSWVEFLTVLGVEDGLRPVMEDLPGQAYGWWWRKKMQSMSGPEKTLDSDWFYVAFSTQFSFPNSMYRRYGDIWRFPGQIEHSDLSDSAKEAFQELVARHLVAHQGDFLTFRLGNARAGGVWDEKQIPTQLAVFLECKSWVAAGSHEQLRFRRPSDCWATRSSKARPPRFVKQVPDALASAIERTESLAELMFRRFGLLDWNDVKTAPRRLQTLAAAAPSLGTGERTGFRREHERAWRELTDTDAELPQSLELAVNRSGRLERLVGDAEVIPMVFVVPKSQTGQAQVLSSAGYPLLEIGEASADKVVERLDATGRFAPRRLGDVRLLVDGKPFAPRAGDPSLASELDWFSEVMLLGHGVMAEGLERGVQHSTVERRVRAIRVRRCRTITLVIDEEHLAPSDGMAWYGFEDPELPTLILSVRVPWTWTTLSRDLSSTIARLIDTRLRYVELLLLRLAMDQHPDALEIPGDEAVARALGCDLQRLQEDRAAMQTGFDHVLHLLVPVIAYYEDATLARQLESDAYRDDAQLDLADWLHAQCPSAGPSPQELIAACKKAANRAALRKDLNLDYERFNRALLALNEPPLSNEAELRSIYDAYVKNMRQEILDRLRRHHAADYRDGRDLSDYTERKTVAFLTFDPDWVLTREILDSETVNAHVSRLLDAVLGEDLQVSVPPLREILEGNRKSVRNFAIRAIPVVGIWCRNSGVPINDPWRGGDQQSLVRHLEDSGLLDFELLDDQRIARLCRRAGCWPKGMPLTLDHAELGFEPEAVSEEERRTEKERDRRAVDRRSIVFAGTKLDTGDPAFAQAVVELAEKKMAGDEGWFERSGRQRLRTSDSRERSSGRSGKRTGGGAGRRRMPPEHTRQAMGLVGEWLAFQYLRRKHGEAVDETCWISGNRAHFFGGDEGDDGAGYDFRVSTPEADWLYEVKSSQKDSDEFEMTANEMAVAARVPRRGRRRYRILYVPFVFDPDHWKVLELPNPMTDRDRFQQIGRGSVRFRFRPALVKKP